MRVIKISSSFKLVLEGIIKGDLNFIYMSREDKTIYSPGPIISFRKASKIS